MPAYYDDEIFTINLMELSDDAAGKLIDHNKSVNVIYESDDGLPGGKPFISVLDAIQGDGFNPLWVEVQIVFNPGFTPRQLTSDTSGSGRISGTGGILKTTWGDVKSRLASP